MNLLRNCCFLVLFSACTQQQRLTSDGSFTTVVTMTRVNCTKSNFVSNERTYLENQISLGDSCLGKMTVGSDNDTSHAITISMTPSDGKYIEIYALLIACEMCTGPVTVQLLVNGSAQLTSVVWPLDGDEGTGNSSDRCDSSGRCRNNGCLKQQPDGSIQESNMTYTTSTPTSVNGSNYSQKADSSNISSANISGWVSVVNNTSERVNLTTTYYKFWLPETVRYNSNMTLFVYQKSSANVSRSCSSLCFLNLPNDTLSNRTRPCANRSEAFMSNMSCGDDEIKWLEYSIRNISVISLKDNMTGSEVSLKETAVETNMTGSEVSLKETAVETNMTGSEVSLKETAVDTNMTGSEVSLKETAVETNMTGSEVSLKETAVETNMTGSEVSLKETAVETNATNSTNVADITDCLRCKNKTVYNISLDVDITSTLQITLDFGGRNCSNAMLCEISQGRLPFVELSMVYYNRTDNNTDQENAISRRQLCISPLQFDWQQLHDGCTAGRYSFVVSPIQRHDVLGRKNVAVFDNNATISANFTTVYSTSPQYTSGIPPHSTAPPHSTDSTRSSKGGWLSSFSTANVSAVVTTPSTVVKSTSGEMTSEGEVSMSSATPGDKLMRSDAMLSSNTTTTTTTTTATTQYYHAAIYSLAVVVPGGGCQPNVTVQHFKRQQADSGGQSRHRSGDAGENSGENSGVNHRGPSSTVHAVVSSNGWGGGNGGSLSTSRGTQFVTQSPGNHSNNKYRMWFRITNVQFDASLSDTLSPLYRNYSRYIFNRTTEALWTSLGYTVSSWYKNATFSNGSIITQAGCTLLDVLLDSNTTRLAINAIATSLRPFFFVDINTFLLTPDNGDDTSPVPPTTVPANRVKADHATAAELWVGIACGVVILVILIIAILLLVAFRHRLGTPCRKGTNQGAGTHDPGTQQPISNWSIPRPHPFVQPPNEAVTSSMLPGARIQAEYDGSEFEMEQSSSRTQLHQRNGPSGGDNMANSRQDVNVGTPRTGYDGFASRPSETNGMARLHRIDSTLFYGPADSISNQSQRERAPQSAFNLNRRPSSPDETRTSNGSQNHSRSPAGGTTGNRSRLAAAAEVRDQFGMPMSPASRFQRRWMYDTAAYDANAAYGFEAAADPVPAVAAAAAAAAADGSSDSSITPPLHLPRNEDDVGRHQFDEESFSDALTYYGSTGNLQNGSILARLQRSISKATNYLKPPKADNIHRTPPRYMQTAAARSAVSSRPATAR